MLAIAPPTPLSGPLPYPGKHHPGNAYISPGIAHLADGY